MVNEKIDLILNTLNLIKEDDSVPRNVRAKIESAIFCLNDNGKRLLFEDKFGITGPR